MVCLLCLAAALGLAKADNVLVRPWGNNTVRIQISPSSWTLTDVCPHRIPTHKTAFLVELLRSSPMIEIGRSRAGAEWAGVGPDKTECVVCARMKGAVGMRAGFATAVSTPQNNNLPKIARGECWGGPGSD